MKNLHTQVINAKKPDILLRNINNALKKKDSFLVIPIGSGKIDFCSFDTISYSVNLYWSGEHIKTVMMKDFNYTFDKDTGKLLAFIKNHGAII